MADYYIKPAGGEQVHGPFDREKLREMAMAGVLMPRDHISTDKQKWHEASGVLAKLNADAATPKAGSVPTGPSRSSASPEEDEYERDLPRERTYAGHRSDWPRIAGYVVFILAAVGCYFYLTHEPDLTDQYGPGTIAPEMPEQINAQVDGVFQHKGFNIHPVADFSLTARVLSREHYSSGTEAAISPVDLALGWGRMSDEQIIAQFEISQSNRFYRWYTKKFPIPRKEVETCSANMHMIPADGEVETKLKAVRRGEIVKIEGMLVNVKRKDGWRWISSKTREDTGPGACEVVYLRDIQIVQPTVLEK